MIMLKNHCNKKDQLTAPVKGAYPWEQGKAMQNSTAWEL